MIDLGAGATLVEASAGTGKTHTITELYLRLVRDHGLDVRSILVITFTDAATGELRERIRNRLRDALKQGGDSAVLSRALSSMDEAPISTIHAFCQRVLTERAFEIGGPFAIEVSAKGSGPLEQWAHERWIRACASAPPAVLSALREHLGPEELARIATLAHAFRTLPLAPPSFDSYADAIAPLGRLEDTLRTAHRAAHTDWSKSRKSIVSFRKSLRLKQYAQQRFTDWEHDLDAWLSGDAWVDPPRVARDLQPDALSTCCYKDSPPERHAFQSRLVAAIEAFDALDPALRRVVFAVAHEVARDAPREVAALERAERHVSFDHLIHGVADALSGPSGARVAEEMRKTYRAALVDEFQDTDRVQYEILRRAFVGAEMPLVLVGDPKQSIYGFRGADVHAYLDAARKAPSRDTLQTSYRSDPAVVEALNVTFERAKDPFAQKNIEYRPIRPRDGASSRLTIDDRPATGLHLAVLSEPSGPYRAIDLHAQLPTLVANDVVELLRPGRAFIRGEPVRPRDIAILVRANEKATTIQSALRAAGVPAVLATEDNVLDTDEACELEQLLSAVLSPGNARRVRTAATTRLLGRTAEAIDTAGDEGLRPLVVALKESQTTWRERGFHPAFRALVERESIAVRMVALPDGERRLTNLLQLGELLHEIGRRESLGPEGLLEWLGAARHDVSFRERVGADALQLRLESDADAVRIATIHKSKGLEYPIVLLPYLWQSANRNDDPLRRVPEPARLRLRSPGLDLPGEADDLARADAEEQSERMRVAYVALTRARHHVRLWVPNTKLEDAPLGRLLRLELPKPKDGDPHAVLQTQLRALARAAKGSISIATSPLGAAPSIAPPEQRGPAALSRASWPEIPFDPHRMASFSHLVSRRQHEPATVEEERELARDVDDADAEPSVAPVEAPRVTLADFPRGRVAGDLLHKIFERLDFARCTRHEVLAIADEELGTSRFDRGLREAVATAVLEVIETPLVDGMKLRAIPAERCVPELEFLLPVSTRIGPQRLSAVLAAHATTPIQQAFARRAEALGFDAWSGWLKGFVDLVFEHDGRFFVVDWKSNHLGDHASDYGPDALAEAMLRHDYVLQYLLYTVALHRHLQLRIRDYDYDRHFGGALYLFLRGMPGGGVFHDRPSRALVEALSRLFEEGAP